MMKMLQLALLVIGSFGAGFLLADGLAQSAPELVLIQGQPTAATSATKTVKCEVATLDMPFSHNQSLRSEPRLVTHRAVTSQQSQADITMPLESYSALVASQQRPATELILHIDDGDFSQMIEQQQQDQQFDEQSERYQLQLSEFFTAYPEIVQSRLLTCSSRFCLLELDVQNFSGWPTVFKTLTAQQWWQSISYQSAAENAANSEQQSSRITLLLQQDWVPLADQQQLAVADGGQFD